MVLILFPSDPTSCCFHHKPLVASIIGRYPHGSPAILSQECEKEQVCEVAPRDEVHLLYSFGGEERSRPATGVWLCCPPISGSCWQKNPHRSHWICQYPNAWCTCELKDQECCEPHSGTAGQQPSHNGVHWDSTKRFRSARAISFGKLLIEEVQKCIPGVQDDPINKPDIYKWPNGDQVHIGGWYKNDSEGPRFVWNWTASHNMKSVSNQWSFNIPAWIAAGPQREFRPGRAECLERKG